MPVWLGLIMLTGIVVNNAIVLVEQIEIEREKTEAIKQAVKNAAAIRLRPILMTTLTIMKESQRNGVRIAMFIRMGNHGCILPVSGLKL